MAPLPVIDMDEQEAHLRVTKSVMATGTDVAAKRKEIKEYFNKTYDIFEKLYSVINSEEAFQMKPLHKLRHPHIFYYGHTATFFMNKLTMGNYTTRINPLYEEMFAIGVDEMQWDDLSSAHYSFPSSSDVKKYRDLVRERINTYIMECPLTLPVQWDDAMWPILMGIEHERIHLETSCVLLRELPLNLVTPSDFWKPCPIRTPMSEPNTMVPVKGDRVTVGRGPQNTSEPGGDTETGKNSDSNKIFGWDVDHGTYTTNVADFEASKFLVSNDEFLQFMNAGGYQNDAYWTKDGRGWRDFRKVTHPHFWVKTPDTDAWKLRHIAEEIELPMSWPAEVNQHEAKAFCAWKSETLGKPVRLPTEAEWSLMFDDFVREDQWEWETAPGNINLEKFTSSCPVDIYAFDGVKSKTTLYDVVGNVWQHTETPTGPLDGFKVHRLYDDFSMPTFDGDHTIQKGGCWMATGNEATRDARFAFRRHFYQMIGIRYIVGEDVDEYAGFYAADPIVDQYTEFHYGKGSNDGFAVNLANAVLKIAEKNNVKTGLCADIGCRSGRTSFELARSVDEVQGVDISARYIMPGCQMRECQQTKWEVPSEGDLHEKRSAQATDFGIEELIGKTTFWQSDPCNLHAHLKGYDIVIVNINLLERLSDPAKFLSGIHERMQSNALLVISSTFNWKTFGLAKDKWIGGTLSEEGVPLSGLEGVKNILSKNFAFLENDSQEKLPYSLPLTVDSYIGGTVGVHAWKKL
eukprot:TRINITY_DN4505_c0_g1_i1.p1 TRINITY_DN4505_c0_g1~~TRINITY_DN4505_c0_g1_i1.p1  ORF type:complete len:758 (+),score=137.90 TRINITY_DN4505_c0_g1_i1:43-2274(+)